MALVVFIFTVDPPAPRVTVRDGLPFVVVEVNGETAGWSFVAVTRLLPVTPAFPKMTIGFGVFGEATLSNVSTLRSVMENVHFQWKRRPLGPSADSRVGVGGVTTDIPPPSASEKQHLGPVEQEKTSWCSSALPVAAV